MAQAGPGLVQPNTRWTVGARLSGLVGDHSAVALGGYLNHFALSLGFPVLVYILMRASGDELMEPHSMCKYG